MAGRGISGVLEALPVSGRLLAIVTASAALWLLTLAAVIVAYRVFMMGSPPVTVVLVAAFLAALAGIGVAALLRGILARPLARQIEELQAARQQAEAASNAKSEFLANMSHELRTPLTAIIGFSDLMKSESLGPLGNRTYVEYAADINFSGTHLLDIINDILDVVRHEVGKMELKEEAVEVEAVISEALRLVAPQAGRGGVALSWAPPAQPLPPLYCDRVRLRQMLLNLLSNAVKFTRPGGSVAVSAEFAEGLTLVVTDTGIGIDPEDIARIMTPFGQVASVYSRNQQGAGLGLPLTKALIERHGGRLSLDSTPGVGTTARLFFPAGRVLRPSNDNSGPD